MDKIILPLEGRTVTGKKVSAMRAEGKTPAVVYGYKAEPQAVSLDTKLLNRAYNQAGGNQLVGLKIDDARQKNALIHDVQLDYKTGNVTHADFYLVNMSEKIKTEVPLHVIGESTAVYQLEGTLIRPLETIEVEALPGDLPDSFELDISGLESFDQTITVGDLKVPAGVEILTAPEEVVAKVDAPRSDEEMAELDEDIKDELPEGVADDDQTAEKEADPATDNKSQNKDNTGA